MTAKTKDEKYIIAAYEMSQISQDDFRPVDRYAVGSRIGMNPKGVESVCRLLAQANFIKNVGQTEFILTPQGKALVQSLLES